MPSREKMTMKRKSRRSRQAMERTEFRREATRFLRDFQYLKDRRWLEEKDILMHEREVEEDILMHERVKGTYLVTLRNLSSRMHLRTDRPSGVMHCTHSRMISTMPHTTTKKSKRLNTDMKYILGPRAYILTIISSTNINSSSLLIMSGKMENHIVIE